MNGGIKAEESHKLVRFLENVPEFLNLEGETIGPFEKGELINIEGKVAEILVSSGKAMFIGEWFIEYWKNI